MRGSHLVKLNVGGRKFVTTEETLSRSATLEAKQRNTGGDDGVIFLDKDPDVFAHVLNIMRGDLTFHQVHPAYKAQVYHLLGKSFDCEACINSKIFRLPFGSGRHRRYLPFSISPIPDLSHKERFFVSKWNT
uniref:Potassium channel tetramerisation-type BTB domain-containing protein n=1 Tax=viral metagenome TaxID=1070528 RepID=A0A6C0BLM3_9ZZZZ